MKHANLTNDSQTVLVTIWENGNMFVAARLDPDGIWGPPQPLYQETGWNSPKVTLSETETV